MGNGWATHHPQPAATRRGSLRHEPRAPVPKTSTIHNQPQLPEETLNLKVTGPIPVRPTSSSPPPRDTARAMSQENVVIVKRALAAYSDTGDVPEDLFDPEIEVWESPELPGDLAGKGHANLVRVKE